eukprot:scaffold38298_cov49-Attheya_sp.AAC.12
MQTTAHEETPGKETIMDDRLFKASKMLLTLAKHMLGEAVARAVPNYQELSNLSDELSTREAEVADFIVPNLDANGDINISGWESAHVAITSIWDAPESAFVEGLLPKFVFNQAKRRRLEVADYLMFRLFFKTYDDTIFHPTADGEWGLWGLTGLQWFGKSVFLHCLALKRVFGARDTLVVWVPTCPETMYHVNVLLVDGFYRGCHARELNGIPFMNNPNLVKTSLDKMKSFAETNGKKLLIIIDQMNSKLECFDSLKRCLKGCVLCFDGRGHRVLLSSSRTGGTATPIFGEACQDLRPLDHFLSLNEIELVKCQHPDSNNLDLLANSEWHEHESHCLRFSSFRLTFQPHMITESRRALLRLILSHSSRQKPRSPNKTLELP